MQIVFLNMNLRTYELMNLHKDKLKGIFEHILMLNYLQTILMDRIEYNFD